MNDEKYLKFQKYIEERLYMIQLALEDILYEVRK
jgi:hypothetical protein